jgi:hypothetical protein
MKKDTPGIFSKGLQSWNGSKSQLLNQREKLLLFLESILCHLNIITFKCNSDPEI